MKIKTNQQNPKELHIGIPNGDCIVIGYTASYWFTHFLLQTDTAVPKRESLNLKSPKSQSSTHLLSWILCLNLKFQRIY